MIIDCPNCGNRVSDKATKCPHCNTILTNDITIKKDTITNFEDLSTEQAEQLINDFEREYPEFAKCHNNSTNRFYAFLASVILGGALLIATYIYLRFYFDPPKGTALAIALPAIAIACFISAFVLTKTQNKKNYTLIQLDKYFKFWLEKRGIYYLSDFESGEDPKYFDSIIVELKEEDS